MDEPLRLLALTNITMMKIAQDGDTHGNYDETALQIIHLAIKVSRIRAHHSVPNPLKMLPLHLRKSKSGPQRIRSIMRTGQAVEHQRLTKLADEVSKAAFSLLSKTRSRTAAKDLCNVFSLGKDGMEFWSQNCRKKTKAKGRTPTEMTSTSYLSREASAARKRKLANIQNGIIVEVKRSRFASEGKATPPEPIDIAKVVEQENAVEPPAAPAAQLVEKEKDREHSKDEEILQALLVSEWPSSSGLSLLERRKAIGTYIKSVMSTYHLARGLKE